MRISEPTACHWHPIHFPPPYPRVNEFGSVLPGNEGGVANGPTSSVDWGDGLNFHEPKILTMRRSGVDLVKYVGITQRQIRLDILARWCRNWSMNRLLLVFLLAPFSMAAQSTLNDLDGDGCVGASDILVILGQYGECQDTTTAFVCGDSVLLDNYWYETVMIGDQCWFAENLRTTVYTDGSTVPEVTEGGAWMGLNSGARCDYGNDAGNVATYGRLYNWYAVDDARGICPAGWHVPYDAEWTDLKEYIISQGFIAGMEGTALKAITGWLGGSPSSMNGTDDFGFSALPGGRRTSYGNDLFNDFPYSGSWWSSSPNGGNAWYRSLQDIYQDLYRNYTAASYGFSVRCLKDPE